MGLGKVLRVWYDFGCPGPLQLGWASCSTHSGRVNLHSLHWILPLIQFHLRHHRRCRSRYTNPHPLIFDSF